MTAPLYSIQGLVQRYGGRTALAVDRLDVEAGSITAVIGPNGSGKSTLLRIMAFLEKPADGTILFQGRNPVTLANPRRDATLLLQAPYLLKRSVYRNVAHGLKLRHDREDVEGRVAEVLEMVGLSPQEFAGRAWYELSGGEAQRVALASRLIFRPRALLLDEPTSSLDVESAERIRQAALRAREKWDTTIVVVSHDHTWLAAVADRTIALTPAIAPAVTIGG